MTSFQYNLEDTYELLLVTPDDEQRIYEHMQNFWGERHRLDLTKEWKANILETYKTTILKSSRDPLGDFIIKLYDRRQAGIPFSMIELGCANGTTLHYLKEKTDFTDIEFVGFEPYDLFVNDLRENFNNAKVIHGGAEDFLEADMSQYGEAPYSAFFAFKVFCMMPPRIARACIEKAATLTDNILLDEYIMNFSGALSQDTTVAFKYDEAVGQINFAHHFQSYFQDIGFDVVDMGEVMNPLDSKKGWAIIHAKRRGIK